METSGVFCSVLSAFVSRLPPVVLSKFLLLPGFLAVISPHVQNFEKCWGLGGLGSLLDKAAMYQSVFF